VDCAYLRGVFSRQVADDPTARVFHDVGVYWDDPDLGHHSPDITVVRGLRSPGDMTDMFYVAEHGVKPVLLIEVVSRSTRKVDRVDKYRDYHQAGVPCYVIVDRARAAGPPQLLGYRYEPAGFVELPPDDQGRLWLEPVRLWLGTVDNRVVCYDEAGRDLGDYAAVSRALAEAEARAKAEARRAKAAERKANAAERKAQTEAQARQAADRKAKDEAKRAKAAGRKAKAEAQARQAAEDRVRALEAELRRLRGDG
jgi:hypothetical protein